MWRHINGDSFFLHFSIKSSRSQRAKKDGPFKLWKTHSFYFGSEKLKLKVLLFFSIQRRDAKSPYFKKSISRHIISDFRNFLSKIRHFLMSCNLERRHRIPIGILFFLVKMTKKWSIDPDGIFTRDAFNSPESPFQQALKKQKAVFVFDVSGNSVILAKSRKDQGSRSQRTFWSFNSQKVSQ